MDLRLITCHRATAGSATRASQPPPRLLPDPAVKTHGPGETPSRSQKQPRPLGLLPTSEPEPDTRSAARLLGSPSPPAPRAPSPPAPPTAGRPSLGPRRPDTRPHGLGRLPRARRPVRPGPWTLAADLWCCRPSSVVRTFRPPCPYILFSQLINPIGQDSSEAAGRPATSPLGTVPAERAQGSPASSSPGGPRLPRPTQVTQGTAQRDTLGRASRDEAGDNGNRPVNLKPSHRPW